jgi:hypothetical protein
MLGGVEMGFQYLDSGLVRIVGFLKEVFFRIEVLKEEVF